jgi:hypothetical protein
LLKRWKTRGRKPIVGTHDAFLLALLWLKNYSRYSELGRSFGLKENTAEDTVMWTLKAIRNVLCEKLIKPIKKAVQVSNGKTTFFILRNMCCWLSSCGTNCGLFLSNVQQDRWEL